jgi:hypothetical protein
VICRAPFCTYEHFDPEFKNASSHNPDGMCLLCGSCQTDTSGGRLSKATIAAKYAARQAETTVRSVKQHFMYFDEMPRIKLGDSLISYAETVLCTDTVDCLSLRREPSSGLLLLKMSMFDNKGEPLFEVEENTWSSEYKPWDFEYAGSTVTFRSAPGDIIFRAKLDAQNGVVEITHLNMRVGRSRVWLGGGKLHVARQSIDGSREVEFCAVFGDLNGKAAIFLDNREDVPMFAESIPLFHESFAGVTFARGGSVRVREWDVAIKGILPLPKKKRMGSSAPREAFVDGLLAVRTVQFPFWTEAEYYLNGILLASSPASVDDLGYDSDGAEISRYHLGPDDAFKFSTASGLIANREEDLPSAPKRPHRFL